MTDTKQLTYRSFDIKIANAVIGSANKYSTAMACNRDVFFLRYSSEQISMREMKAIIDNQLQKKR